MHGVSLGELDVADMLDVIHYMFEEDMRIPSAEVAEAVSKSRSILYREMYNRDYAYSVKTGAAFLSADIDPPLGDDDDVSDITPVDPARGGRASANAKPYFPPTDFNPDAVNPFGTTLDAPLG